MKNLEAQRQQDYIINCKKILKLVKERQKDYVLDQIIQMDESVRAINTDIQAFKNIRTQLFQRDSKVDQEKFIIYFFHIFESVVNNTSNLVSKYSSHLIQ